MIRINRTTEYGLMALRHMSRKREKDCSEVTSAREVSDSYGLPFEITAKTLQRLKDTGLIQSAHGAKGGYTLQRDLYEITLAEFLQLMEGPQSLVACSSLGAEDTAKETAKDAEGAVSRGKGGQPCQCEYEPRCEIRHVMGDLNSRVFQFLSGIRLSDLARTPVLSVVSSIGKAEHPTQDSMVRDAVSALHKPS